MLSLARQQRSEGHDAEVLTLNRVFHKNGELLSAKDVVQGIPVRRIGYFGSYKYPIATRAAAMLQGFDIVHVHGVDFFCDYLAGLKPLHRKPLVLSTHGGFFHTGYARTLKKIYFNTATRTALKLYSRVFASSIHDLALFEPLAGNRSVLIENGVDVEKYRDAASDVFRPTYLFLGRFASNKRLDLLINTFQQLAERDPRSELYIVGREWDGLLPDMTRAIQSAGLEGRVHIHTDLDDDQVREIMQECSFFISASEYEGFGISVVEGMSAGLIPITSPIASFCEIIDKAAGGLTIDFADAKAAAAKIEQFTAKSQRRYGELRAKFIKASQDYSWHTVAQEFTRHYEAVIGKHRRTIFGISFQTGEPSDIVSAIDESFVSGQRINVAFANAHSINLAASNPAYLSVFKNFFVLNNGLGVNIASRMKFGKTFSEDLNSIDFVPRFLRETCQTYRIFLLGAREEVVERAAEILQEQFPQHKIVGFHHGYFDSQHDGEITRRIREAHADLVLVGMGNPLQEFWINNNAEASGARILLGVGSLFDFTAGRVRRAPAWVRHARLEWLFRSMQEPQRLWRRYLVGNAMFLKKVLFEG